jgi:hypothetical protein
MIVKTTPIPIMRLHLFECCYWTRLQRSKIVTVQAPDKETARIRAAGMLGVTAGEVRAVLGVKMTVEVRSVTILEVM